MVRACFGMDASIRGALQEPRRFVRAAEAPQDPVDAVQIVNPYAGSPVPPLPAFIAPPPVTQGDASPSSSLRQRLSAAALLALSLVAGAPLSHALAAEAPAAITVVPPAQARSQQPAAFAPASRTSAPTRPLVDTLPASTRLSAVDTLPAPTATSRNRMDRVEINARLEQAAQNVGLPPELLKAVAWQETNWMHTRPGGGLVVASNRHPATHEVLSVDSGLMQINDKAHPEAFPRARTLDGNIRYGARLLKDMVNEYGVKGAWHYNGDPEYQRALDRHMAVRPWTAGVMTDYAKALESEKSSLEKSIPRDTRAVAVLQRKAFAAKENVHQWEQKVERERDASRRKAADRDLQVAQRGLTKAQERLSAATDKLAQAHARLQALPGLVADAGVRAQAERARVSAAEETAYGTLRADLLKQATAHVERLEEQRRAALEMAARLQGLSRQSPRSREAADLGRDVRALRQRATQAEASWRSVQEKLQGQKRVSLLPIARDLRKAGTRLQSDVSVRTSIEQRLEKLGRTAPTGVRAATRPATGAGS